MSRPLQHHLVLSFAVGLSLASPAIPQVSPASPKVSSAIPKTCPAPALVDFQGCLNDASGSPVRNGSFHGVASLWDSANVGAPWQSQAFRLPNAGVNAASSGNIGMVAARTTVHTTGQAGQKPDPAEVPYIDSGTPGISVRFIPSDSPAGGLGQVYLKPGASLPETPALSIVPSRDPRYSQSFPGPNNTTILMTDPARAISQMVRVTPSGELEFECKESHDDRPAGHSTTASGHIHPAAVQGKGAGR